VQLLVSYSSQIPIVPYYWYQFVEVFRHRRRLQQFKIEKVAPVLNQTPRHEDV